MGERKYRMSPDDGGWRRGNRLMGVVMTGLGLFIILISANIIPMADSTFSAPRWLAGCAGLAILMAGAAVVLARPGATPGSIAANPYLGGAAFGVGAVIMDLVVVLIAVRGIKRWLRGSAGRAAP